MGYSLQKTKLKFAMSTYIRRTLIINSIGDNISCSVTSIWMDPKNEKNLHRLHARACNNISPMCYTNMTQYYIAEGFIKFITTGGGGARYWWFVVICLLPAIRKVIKTILRDPDSFHYLSLATFFFFCIQYVAP